MILLVLFLVGSAVEAQLKCGYTPIPHSRVIGGHDATPGAWPWQIALKRYGSFICGGSLISADWVVTAAHCVASSSVAGNYQIVVGDHNRNTNEGTEQSVAAERIISHPQYNNPRLNNDIALIELSQPVTLSSRVNPVCLPSYDFDVPTGSTCYITGWGKIKHPGSSHPILQQAMMPPIDNQKCSQKIQASGAGITLTSKMLCAGVENTILSGCHGDSGGPYVCVNSDKTYTLHGAVSWGSGKCDASQLFTVFARVTQFRDWIKQHTGISGGGGSPLPPTGPTPTTPGSIGQFSCNFDSGSLCGFMQELGDDFDWTLLSGSTPSYSTGPSADVSGNGSYLYIESSSPRVFGEKAVISKSGLLLAGSKCLSFYYHMYGADMGTLNVYVGQKMLFRISGNQGNLWIKKELIINEPGASKISFEAVRGTSFTSDAAIDVVELRMCGSGGSPPPPSTPPVPPIPTTISPPTPSTPTPPAPTTPGGIGQFSCDFDSGSFCGFVQQTNDNFDWTLNSGSTPSSSTGPSSDVSGSGNYLYIEASSPRTSYDYAAITKYGLSFVGQKCLSFYYHMYGLSMGELKVFVGARRVFVMSGDQGDNWIKAELVVNLPAYSTLRFEGIVGSDYRSDVAIDNVVLRDCPSTTPPIPTTTNPPSPPTPTPPVPTTPGNIEFSCDFSDISLCGFVQSNNDQFNWTSHMGSTTSVGTGPSEDVSGNGIYLYIEASYPRVAGDKAIIIKNGLSFAGSKCLSFYYHMYGADMGTLNVYVGQKVVFNISGNQGNHWIKKELIINEPGASTLLFEGIVGSSYQSDAAIDNIVLRDCGGGGGGDGGCSTAPPPVTGITAPSPTTPSIKPVICSFDTDECSFSYDSAGDFNWTRMTGSTSSLGTGPSGDHTPGSSGKGYYMYIETSYPRVKDDVARLVSPPLDFNGQMCLKFFYHMYGTSMGTLNVLINGKQVFSMSGNQGDQWIEKRIDENYYPGKYQVTFEGIAGSDYTSDAAIDDFSLTPGSCPGGVTSPPSTPFPGTPPPPGSCGVRPQTRIVGGTAANHGDWPWQAQLRTTGGFPYCGGSLVSPQWLVTATHCVDGTSPGSIIVRLGAHERLNNVGSEQDIRVTKVITHPSYHKPLSYSHDIALLKLEQPAILNKYVNLLCLPQSVPAPTDGTKCWITGWGTLSSGGSTPTLLQQVDVPVTSHARCQNSYPGKIHDSMICAGLDQGGIDSCQGDSGGPMACETGGKYYLQGVTSWGNGCAYPGKFGVYAKVKYLLNWLNQEMAKN